MSRMPLLPAGIHYPLYLLHFLPPPLGMPRLALDDGNPLPSLSLAPTSSLFLSLSCFQISVIPSRFAGNMLYCKLYRLRL